MRSIQIYDTTLRDGTQGEGVSLSLQDKLQITQRLDELGVDFVEGGYPASNTKDAEYFQRATKLPLKSAKICAFGMTRRRGMKPADDTGIQALLAAETPVVTIVGKTWDFHVTEVPPARLQQNIQITAKTVRYLTRRGRDVFSDPEHF